MVTARCFAARCKRQNLKPVTASKLAAQCLLELLLKTVGSRVKPLVPFFTFLLPRKCRPGLIKLPPLQLPRYHCYRLQASSNFLFKATVSFSQRMPIGPFILQLATIQNGGFSRIQTQNLSSPAALLQMNSTMTSGERL